MIALSLVTGESDDFDIEGLFQVVSDCYESRMFV
jgi:hypothetical protein